MAHSQSEERMQKTKSIAARLWLLSLFNITSVLISSGSAFAGVDDYPAPWRAPTEHDHLADTWGELSRECVSFVAFRLHDRNGFDMTWHGDASLWQSNASGYFPIDNTPAVGAVAWFSYGHVAWVEAIPDSQHVTIEEYNYSSPYNYDERTILTSSVSSFIHFKDLPCLLQTSYPIPQVILGPYGYIEVFSRGISGSIWHICQSAPNSGWMPWDNFGGTVAGNPVVTVNQNGVIQFFVRALNNQINSIAQYSKGGAWGSWGSLGGSITGDPTLGMNSIGVLQAFVTGTDGLVDSLGQSTPNGSWGTWGNFGGGPTLVPVVAANLDGRLEVFARFADGHVWHMWQTSPSGPWSSWQQLGDVQTIGHPIVGTNSDGRLEVFTIGLNGTLQECWQQTPNGNWSTWAAIQPSLSFTANPSVGRDRNGNLNVFGITSNGTAYVSKQVPGGWSAWSSLGGTVSAELAVATNQDGRLQLIGRGANGVMWQQWQDYNGNWSGWQVLGDGVARF